MSRKPLFAGLVVDERDRVAESAVVGEEPFYVVDDAGFRRHIPAVQVDRQVLKQMQEMMFLFAQVIQQYYQRPVAATICGAMEHKQHPMQLVLQRLRPLQLRFHQDIVVLRISLL